MMIGTDYPQDHLPDDDGVGFLAGVAPWLWSADVAFGNLEGVLVDGGEPGKKCSNPKACYLFRSPSRYAFHYRAAGFDVLSLANNHARDFGEEGRTATMQALAAAGIYHSGREGDFASFEVKGLRIAVLEAAMKSRAERRPWSQADDDDARELERLRAALERLDPPTSGLRGA